MTETFKSDRIFPFFIRTSCIIYDWMHLFGCCVCSLALASSTTRLLCVLCTVTHMAVYGYTQKYEQRKEVHKMSGNKSKQRNFYSSGGASVHFCSFSTCTKFADALYVSASLCARMYSACIISNDVHPSADTVHVFFSSLLLFSSASKQQSNKKHESHMHIAI